MGSVLTALRPLAAIWAIAIDCPQEWNSVEKSPRAEFSGAENTGMNPVTRTLEQKLQAEPMDVKEISRRSGRPTFNGIVAKRTPSTHAASLSAGGMIQVRISARRVANR
jgi:hypothetical protein